MAESDEHHHAGQSRQEEHLRPKRNWGFRAAHAHYRTHHYSKEVWECVRAVENCRQELGAIPFTGKPLFLASGR
jgi:hypothetical protein